ncbi:MULTISPECIES: hypothetical protein [Allobranchiibius]|uniref:Uncharacterized protein n=1 Tax=Allobranchiibius huperziae TaxID=1874116 RepID=A0A853D8Q4_9MICO|nr:MULTISPECIES: hypothetical protein [Allobranchiibius]NYJ73836.1 hypothetical protein [Allobranchiibius huperziae]UIJ34735.1 hypothetical protein LVQ62_16825 [Allobranchiibius sp. GilTou73]
MTSPPAPTPGAPAGSEVTIPIRRQVTPPSVHQTVRLMYAGAVLSVLAALVELHARGDIRASLERHNAHTGGRRLGAHDISDAAGFTVSFMVCAAILSAILWLALAWGIRHGSRRARLFGTVLAVLCVLKVYGTLTQGGTPVLGVLVDLAQLAVAVAVTVLMWSRRSAAHFEPPARDLG